MSDNPYTDQNGWARFAYDLNNAYVTNDEKLIENLIDKVRNIPILIGLVKQSAESIKNHSKQDDPHHTIADKILEYLEKQS